MSRKTIDLHRRVRDVLAHSVPPSPAAARPLEYFEQAAAAGSLLIDYIERHVRPERKGAAPHRRQMGHLRRMVLSELLTAFERFLREVAAVCIDLLAPFAIDDRFDDFLPRTTGNVAAFAETAMSVNQRIGRRLALVLEQFHRADPTLFDAQSKADAVSQRFALAVTISDRTGAF